MTHEVIAHYHGISQAQHHDDDESHDGPEQHISVILVDLVCLGDGGYHYLVAVCPGYAVIPGPFDRLKACVAVRKGFF